MTTNQRIKVIVAEPWDFASSEGNNVFTATIMRHIYFADKEAYLLRVEIPFELTGQLVRYAVATSRDQLSDLARVNIAYIPDECVDRFDHLSEVEWAMEFVIIGLMKTLTED